MNMRELGYIAGTLFVTNIPTLIFLVAAFFLPSGLAAFSIVVAALCIQVLNEDEMKEIRERFNKEDKK